MQWGKIEPVTGVTTSTRVLQSAAVPKAGSHGFLLWQPQCSHFLLPIFDSRCESLSCVWAISIGLQAFAHLTAARDVPQSCTPPTGGSILWSSTDRAITESSKIFTYWFGTWLRQNLKSTERKYTLISSNNIHWYPPWCCAFQSRQCQIMGFL